MHRYTPVAFIDIETTGIDPIKTEIIEIAVVFSIQKMTLWNLLDMSAVPFQLDKDLIYWHTRIKPMNLETAESAALNINGYTDHPELWADAPVFEDVAPIIHTIFQHVLPAGHNIKFDLAHIKESMRRSGFELSPIFGKYSIDTITLAHEHLSPNDLQGLKLENICNVLGVSNDGMHSALVDAIRARDVYYKLLRATWWDRWRWKKKIQKIDCSETHNQ